MILGQRCGDDRLEKVIVLAVTHELSDKSQRRHMRVGPANSCGVNSLQKTSRMRPIETDDCSLGIVHLHDRQFIEVHLVQRPPIQR